MCSEIPELPSTQRESLNHDLHSEGPEFLAERQPQLYIDIGQNCWRRINCLLLVFGLGIKDEVTYLFIG